METKTKMHRDTHMMYARHDRHSFQLSFSHYPKLYPVETKTSGNQISYGEDFWKLGPVQNIYYIANPNLYAELEALQYLAPTAITIQF